MSMHETPHGMQVQKQVNLVERLPHLALGGMKVRFTALWVVALPTPSLLVRTH